MGSPCPRPKRDRKERRPLPKADEDLLAAFERLSVEAVRRALGTPVFYAQMGLPVRIHFGLKPDLRRMEGHSWLTLEGKPLCEGDQGLERYQRVYSYPEGMGGRDGS